jgi:hypothetical protein
MVVVRSERGLYGGTRAAMSGALALQAVRER